ncbi:MAG: transposase, partial [Desulfuromonadales bacterium]|nr:transposase [Desulfuromonadales bacterium]
VMNRGRRKEDIFLTSDDRRTFLGVLKETAEIFNLNISAYCLMSNHYHLLLNTPDGNLSRCMRHINGVYTQRFNRRHDTDGSLFRGRYKAVLIEEDRHLLEVLRYIHRNPIRAGIVKKVEEFTWSSHHAYTSRAKKWDWLHKDALLSLFAEKKKLQEQAYVDFVLQDDSVQVTQFYEKKNLPSFFGSEKFKDRVKEKFSHLRQQKEILRSREFAVTIPEIIETVCRHHEISPEQLLQSKRGRENRTRDVAIYLARQCSAATLLEIGGYFRLKNYSSVSSAVQRIRTKKNKDLLLRQLIKTLENKLNKSQTKT